MADSREYPTRPICSVGAIVRDGDVILLIERGNPPRRGGWSIPGGVVKLGETARREVCEECGIEIEVGDVVDALDIIVRDDAHRVQYHYALVDFAATYVSGDLRASTGALDARWVPLGELSKFPLPDPTRAVIRKAIRPTTDDR